MGGGRHPAASGRLSLSKAKQVVHWPECERLVPHVLAVADYGQRLEVESERLVVAAQASWRGHSLWSRGPVQGKPLTLGYEQTLAARDGAQGDDHPSTLNSMNNLAETRRALGDLQGAHGTLQRADPGRLPARALGRRPALRTLKLVTTSTPAIDWAPG